MRGGGVLFHITISVESKGSCNMVLWDGGLCGVMLCLVFFIIFCECCIIDFTSVSFFNGHFTLCVKTKDAG